jgi:hypothetical protein
MNERFLLQLKVRETTRQARMFVKFWPFNRMRQSQRVAQSNSVTVKNGR